MLHWLTFTLSDMLPENFEQILMETFYLNKNALTTAPFSNSASQEGGCKGKIVYLADG